MLRGADKRLFLAVPLGDIQTGYGFWKRMPDSHSMEPPISGYTSWYDFSDISTVTVSANLITAVTDKGSGAQNLSATVGNAHLCRTSPTGRHAAFFGNGSEYLSSGASASDDSQTAFVVANCFGFAAGRTLIGPNNDSGNQFRVDATTGRLTTNRADSAAIGTQSNAAVTAGTPFVATQVLTSSQVTQYLNTTSETDVVAPSFTGGRTLTIGRSPTVAGAGDPHSGWIGEVLIYGSTLSGGDVTTTIAYLMSKWDIT